MTFMMSYPMLAECPDGVGNRKAESFHLISTVQSTLSPCQNPSRIPHRLSRRCPLRALATFLIPMAGTEISSREGLCWSPSLVKEAVLHLMARTYALLSPSKSLSYASQRHKSPGQGERCSADVSTSKLHVTHIGNDSLIFDAVHSVWTAVAPGYHRGVVAPPCATTASGSRRQPAIPGTQRRLHFWLHICALL